MVYRTKLAFLLFSNLLKTRRLLSLNLAQSNFGLPSVPTHLGSHLATTQKRHVFLQSGHVFSRSVNVLFPSTVEWKTLSGLWSSGTIMNRGTFQSWEFWWKHLFGLDHRKLIISKTVHQPKTLQVTQKNTVICCGNSWFVFFV